MRRIIVLCAAVLACGIARGESADDFPPDKIVPADETSGEADVYKVRVEGGSAQELERRAWQLIADFCNKTVNNSVTIESSDFSYRDGGRLKYTFRCTAGPQEASFLPNGLIFQVGPDTYKIHVGDGPMDYVQKEASQLMKEFCKKTNRRVAVTDSAYDGGMGLRYTFTCVPTPEAAK